jgi:hypothetical protein
MDSNRSNQREADFKQLKELFPDIDSEMIVFSYSEQNCNLENCIEYLLTHVPQSNSETPKDTSTKSAHITDELIARAVQEILMRNEEPTPENIEKEIQKLPDVSEKKEDISRDELIAQAIQTLLNRNEEISESNIEKEILQMQTDVLLAHEIQFGGQRRSESERNRDKELMKEPSKITKEPEKPSEITIGIENFFRDVGEGIRSTVASITEFVEAKLEDNDDDDVSTRKEENMKLLGDKDVELNEINLQNVLHRGSLDDLDEGFLDSGESLKEPIGLVSLKTGSLVFRESNDGD